MVGFKIHPACIFKKNSLHNIGTLKYHRLHFHRLPITSLHMTTSSTPPPDKSSLLTINFDSNFVMSLSLAIFFFATLFLFGQTIRLQTKSDMTDIAEKIISKIDSRFATERILTNEKFAEVTTELNELKDVKLQWSTIITTGGAILSFIGIQPLLEFTKAKWLGQNTTTNTNTDKPKRK